MKLLNKTTGEIGYLISTNWNETSLIIMDKNGVQLGKYNSLSELNSEWEDYEEPKDTNYWCIDSLGKIEFHSTVLDEIDGTPNNAMVRKIIGNYFDTREEAEKAVEKLKAVKRLKDKGFRFHEWYKPDGCEPFIVVETNIGLDDVDSKKLQKDLDLLFGGEA